MSALRRSIIKSLSARFKLSCWGLGEWMNDWQAQSRRWCPMARDITRNALPPNSLLPAKQHPASSIFTVVVAAGLLLSSRVSLPTSPICRCLQLSLLFRRVHFFWYWQLVLPMSWEITYDNGDTTIRWSCSKFTTHFSIEVTDQLMVLGCTTRQLRCFWWSLSTLSGKKLLLLSACCPPLCSTLIWH